MRVMCIKKDNWVHASTNSTSEGNDPAFGEIVNVYHTLVDTDGAYYCLDNYEYAYCASEFVNLSGIDEMELLEERQQQLQLTQK